MENDPLRYCFYCGRRLNCYPAKYGRGYSLFKCSPCGASVGSHPGTSIPLGTVAKPELRKLRKIAHDYFDPLWEGKIKRDKCTKKQAREAGYKWLAEQLGIPYRDCHFGLFREDQCQQAIAICKKYYSKN